MCLDNMSALLLGCFDRDVLDAIVCAFFRVALLRNGFPKSRKSACLVV